MPCLAFVLAPNPLLDRVLVVMNAESPVSVELGADYLKQRGVKQRLLVHCADSSLDAGKETIAYPDFKVGIEQPLRAYLSKHPKIDFILLTKGIPIRIHGAPGLGLRNDTPSVDSFIAALDYDKSPEAFKIHIDDSGFKGSCYANRFWGSHERFSHAKFGGYLVTRLDGYTMDSARLLVRYAIQSEKQKPSGPILLDSNATFSDAELKEVPIPIFATKNGVKSHDLADVAYKHWTMDLDKAGAELKARGLPVDLDTDIAFTTGQNLMGYASWGSNDGKFDATKYKNLRFAPGAIAETAVSTSARTLLPTTGGQSLIADVIEGRVTGVKGYCDEPLLTAVASPTILFDRYTQGWTLAESFYAASRWIGWEGIVVGDPICQPYGR